MERASSRNAPRAKGAWEEHSRRPMPSLGPFTLYIHHFPFFFSSSFSSSSSSIAFSVAKREESCVVHSTRPRRRQRRRRRRRRERKRTHREGPPPPPPPSTLQPLFRSFRKGKAKTRPGKKVSTTFFLPRLINGEMTHKYGAMTLTTATTTISCFGRESSTQRRRRRTKQQQQHASSSSSLLRASSGTNDAEDEEEYQRFVNRITEPRVKFGKKIHRTVHHHAFSKHKSYAYQWQAFCARTEEYDYRDVTSDEAETFLSAFHFKLEDGCKRFEEDVRTGKANEDWDAASANHPTLGLVAIVASWKASVEAVCGRSWLFEDPEKEEPPPPPTTTKE